MGWFRQLAVLLIMLWPKLFSAVLLVSLATCTPADQGHPGKGGHAWSVRRLWRLPAA